MSERTGPMSETEPDCVFCHSTRGALVRLWQGWCCLDCLSDLLSRRGLRE
jgi:hypothetical protein